MYIRKSIRSYHGRTYTNYVLVESVHTAKGPRQKTICSLGDLSPRPREAWIEFARKIEDALLGQSHLLDTDESEVADIVDRVRARRRNEQRRGEEHPPPPAPLPANRGALIKVDPTRVATEQHREAGPVHVGYQFWQRLELDRILSDCDLPKTVRRLASAMVLNRLIAPASDMSTLCRTGYDVQHSPTLLISTSTSLKKIRSIGSSTSSIRTVPRSRRPWLHANA